MNICPTCKQRMPSAKATSPADKKLKEDRVKATAAIGVCERSATRPDFAEGLRLACLAEAQRLTRAIDTPSLLWSIYRRKDKGISYVT